MRKTAALLFSTALLSLMLTTACSSGAPSGSQEGKAQQKEAPKPPDLNTGREAFQRLYGAARGWSADVKPFRIQSETTSDANGHDGKAGVWRVSFASPARGSVKTWVWSGVGEPKSRGITPGSEDTYNPNNASTKTFDVAFLKVDSDKAFEVAQKNGGEKVLKQDANLPVFYVVDWDSAENRLMWHVIYGENRNDAKLRIEVNASSGAFVKKER